MALTSIVFTYVFASVLLIRGYLAQQDDTLLMVQIVSMLCFRKRSCNACFQWHASLDNDRLDSALNQVYKDSICSLVWESVRDIGLFQALGISY